jgi:hypothetical protein
MLERVKTEVGKGKDETETTKIAQLTRQYLEENFKDLPEKIKKKVIKYNVNSE